MELQDVKSSKSLAEIYEEDFTNAREKEAGNKVVAQVDKDLEKKHAEIEDLFDELSGKLDALSNARFTPKPVCPLPLFVSDDILIRRTNSRNLPSQPSATSPPSRSNPLSPQPYRPLLSSHQKRPSSRIQRTKIGPISLLRKRRPLDKSAEKLVLLWLKPLTNSPRERKGRRNVRRRNWSGPRGSRLLGRMGKRRDLERERGGRGRGRRGMWERVGGVGLR